MTKSDITAQEWKEKGNEEFNKGNWSEALNCYTNALKLAKEDNTEKAVYYKNRAAAFLKLKDYEKVVKDCDDSLKICPNDPKALFRRCQALEALDRFEEAYRDARNIILSDPNNKSILPIATRLHEIVQERFKENSRVSAKVSQMFDLAFTMTNDKEKRETAMNNLLVLARERAGAEEIFKEGGVSKITKLLKLEKNEEIICSAIRIVGELCKNNISRTKSIIADIGLPWCLEMINSKFAERVTAAQYCLQTILNTYSGLDNKPDSKPDKALCEVHKKEIDTILSCLLYSVTNRTITGLARDAIIELIIRNVHYTALDWAERLVDLRGLQRLMEVASEMEEYKYESSMDVTSSTRTITSVCLAKIYENMYYDAAKEKFRNAIDEFIKDKLLTPNIESKVRVVVAITTLLLGPLDVGNAIVAKEGILEMILVMAGTDDVLQQKVACECIVAAASKKDKAATIINQGVNILKKLYQSKDDSIRVRALVGLCKLGSSGGTDATIKPFAEGATKKLAEACRRFLINPKKQKDMRKWAVEGLSYLTFDAEVKEKLIEDQEAIQAMIEVAKTGDQSVLYGVVTTLVNLCNAYDKQELIPEMIELAKFAKHHIPEEHELDEPDFVNKRLCTLAKAGVTSALVSLAKTDSQNSKELIARVFNAICSQVEVRGIVVQQGGAKALLPLALDGTEKGKKQASQALARLGITINPEVAFPGQRIMEVVRPFINLLNPECSALENFESLMALCNLAGVNDSVRKRILKEGGFQKIESYMYEDHDMLRRAATQVINNLIMCDETIQYFEKENDRVKYLVILCEEEDQDTSMAAAGALAMLTSVSKAACIKIFDSKDWLESLRFLLANPNSDMQHRGVIIVLNMMKSTKDVAARLIETDVMEILMALSKNDNIENKKIKELASAALEAAAKWELIRNIGETQESQSTSNIEHID
ncbi:protein unc-45 homolog B [Pseudomyrmex gracilis]|uniref:protein unc-45 homolog B n=1 Tax=Pseudomyrmex gracilis TaxID=219809 RepID=UPI0009953D64|nr:protein unc-45 homolog B [Pseudomyrmex gracilis]XP_020282814.1 protein unc-45 homolog B [Pseudomyrmex gracilis]XP_020282815.1 protein unc-45 homolog B [Pseudomyrmex gracilis]XP_020282816.1 protein unc-45 homolog B [Pseudomyrmex gracilis]XP_020282817.1 protein unc-45 homolog B [Pseudomyrmex gracilis]XP_020282818.1 protein unc-45 homolog B [Pseudomyrmex gracilis]XP_020282819.1 protein unc-45 homolog B [Pseudomyrmex gracilis]